MNHHNRNHRTPRIVLAVALLGTGIASAQTRPTLELRGTASAVRAVAPANTNRSSAFESLSIDRTAVQPLDVQRVDLLSGYSRSRAGEVALCQTLATLVKVMPTTTGNWMPSGVSPGNLTNLGMYDR